MAIKSVYPKTLLLNSSIGGNVIDDSGPDAGDVSDEGAAGDVHD